MKKIILIMIMLTFLLSFNSLAVDFNDSLVACYSFDTDASEDWNGSGIYDGEVNGATHGTADCVLGGCYGFDGVNDFINVSEVKTTHYGLTDQKAYVMWIKVRNFEAVGGYGAIFTDKTEEGMVVFNEHSNAGLGIDIQAYDGGWQKLDNVDETDNGWNLVILNINETVLSNSTVNTTDIDTFAVGTMLHAGGNEGIRWGGGLGDEFSDVLVDEVYIFNRYLNTDDIDTLYNSGSGLSCYNLSNPVAPPTNVTGLNESLQNSFYVNLSAPVTVSGSSFITIFSTEFENVVNTTSYFTTVLNLESNFDNQATCRLLVNGTDYGSEISKTNNANQKGVMYLTTTNVTLENGTHELNLECKKSGAGNFEILTSDTIAHLLYNANNESLNSLHGTFNVSSGVNNFELVHSVLFNTSDLTPDTEHNSTIVVQSSLLYSYNQTGIMSSYVSINGTNCPVIPRYGENGDFGVGSLDCIVNNLGFNNTINISFYSKGNGTITSNFNIKEFIVDLSETNLTSLNDTNITSSTLTKIKTLQISDIDHEQFDLYAKAIIPLSSVDNTITNSSFQLRLNDGTINSTIINRTVNETGIVIIQYLFSNLATGNYTIDLYASCDNSNCTSDGGLIESYFTNEIDTITDTTFIEMFNHWDNSSIQNYTVFFSSGLSFDVTNFNITINHENDIENVTIASSDNGGYFNRTFFNVNLSNNISETLFNNIINFNAIEIFSGNNISTFTLNGGLQNLTTTTGNVTMYPITGSNIEINFTNLLNYYNLSVNFNFTGLQNETLNYSIFNHLINFSAVNALTGELLNDFNISMTSNGFTTLTQITGLNGTVPVVLGLNYTSTFNKSGYALFSANHTSLTGLNSSYQYLVYTTNSLNITYYHAETGVLLNTTTITVQFIGLTAQTNTTTNGTLFVDLFSPDSYTILSDATGFRQNKYIINITSKSFQNLNLYLQPENTSNLVLLTVTDRFGTRLQSVQIIIQKWLNDAWVTDQIVETDFNGQAEGYYILSDVFYNHVLKYQGSIQFGAINDDNNKKIIYAEDATNGIRFKFDVLNVTDASDYLNILGNTLNLSFNNVSNITGFFRYFFSSQDNSQLVGKLNIYNAATNELLCTNSTTTATGTLFCVISTTSIVTYRAVGYIDNVPMIEYIISFGPEKNQIDFNTLGYFIGFCILIIAYFMFIEVPTISLYSGSVAFIVISMLGIMFRDLNFIVHIVLLALTYLVASIKSESGVNA